MTRAWPTLACGRQENTNAPAPQANLAGGTGHRPDHADSHPGVPAIVASPTRCHSVARAQSVLITNASKACQLSPTGSSTAGR